MKFPEGIAAQPAALATSLANLNLPSYEGGLIALVGIGASEHAAHGAAAAWRSLGLQAVSISASAPPVDAAVTLLISESGRSSEVLAYKSPSRTIALTNFADSPLATAADEVILLNSGPDTPVYTTGYTTTLQALGVLGTHWTTTSGASSAQAAASAHDTAATAPSASTASAHGAAATAPSASTASAHGTAATAPSASTASAHGTAGTAPSASTASAHGTAATASSASTASAHDAAATAPGASTASGLAPSSGGEGGGRAEGAAVPASDEARPAVAFDWTSLPALVSTALVAPLGAASGYLDEARVVDVVASGVSVATSGEGGLLLRESGRLHTAVHETRNYLHGPMEILDEQTTCLLIGDGREVQLAYDVREYGTKVVLITTREVEEGEGLAVIRLPQASDGLARAVLEMVVVQRLGWEVAQRRGLRVDGFRHRQSDTKVS
jgi:glutamine---fructose-6-phosphate transaminase (isomerizing)